MKILVASDLHGSLYYTQKLIEIYQQEQADQILLLGDILYHGPRNPLPKDYNPAEVVKLLNSYADKIWAVRGNCDSEVDQMVLDFNISADMMPLHIEDTLVIATHGHIYNKQQPPKVSGTYLLLFGHIHIPMAQKTDFGFIGNPGSLVLPKDNHPSSYGLLTKDKWTVKDIGGEIIAEIELSK